MTMSSGMYHRRWPIAGNDSGGSSTTFQHNQNITQTIAPHTYGTSWNSVRWNKSLESSNRYRSRSRQFFETISNEYDTKSSYSIPHSSGRFGSLQAGKNNIELKNSGPYKRERSVCFGNSVLSVMNDKISSRTSPQLPWLSDNLANRRNMMYNKVARNSRENAFTSNSSRWASTAATRSFQTGIRNTTTIPASTLTSINDRPSLSNMTQMISNSNHGNTAFRTDRPWRRRIADAARSRGIHGDEIGGAIHPTFAVTRARRSSISNGRKSANSSGDELRTSLNALKNYIDEQTMSFYRQSNRFAVRDSYDKLSFDNSAISVRQHTPVGGFYSIRWNSGRIPEYMSRSYSPIRPKPNAFNNTMLSKYNSISTDMLLRPVCYLSQSNVNNACEKGKSHMIDQIVRNSLAPISNCERETHGRLLFNKERKLRHRSRQRKLEMESNSSSDTEQQHIEVRKRKLRKRPSKKSNDEGKSENKELLTNAEKRAMITDNEITVEIDIHKENAAEAREMERNQILNEASSLITFSITYNERLELKIKFTEFDRTQVEKSDKERKNKVIKKELKSFEKRIRSTKKKKCDNATDNINHKNEMKNAKVEKKKGNKTPTRMLKMPNIETELADGTERCCLNGSQHQLLAPTIPSSSNNNNSHSITTMDDISSIDNHFEVDEKKHYNGVTPQFNFSDERRHPKSKFAAALKPAPVPGTWSRPSFHEINISHNKRLQRRETCSNDEAIGIITTKYISYTIPAVKICATKLQSRRPLEITLNCAFQRTIENNEKVSFVQKYPRIIKMGKKLLAIINATIEFDASFTYLKRSMNEGVVHIIEIKRQHAKCSMIVKEPTIRIISIQKTIYKKSDARNSCRAQVTVLTSPVSDMNFYQCLKRVQITHPKSHPIFIENASKQSYIVEENNTEEKKMNEMNCASNQLLSQKVNINEVLSVNDEFLLTDYSLLENYVDYKRMHREKVDFNDRESSCPLPASEPMRACAVRILEPTRQVPFITAPSRSRLGNVDVESVSAPVRTYVEQLLSRNSHGMKNLTAVRSKRSASLTKPSFEFNPPMSPFEQSLQNQAFKLRKIPTLSDGDVPAVQDTPPVVDITMQLPVHDHSGHPSVEGPSLTSNFTAAVAAAAQPRHERYAAHIPITRLDGSGRQSATSIDSYNSGTLETTTVQLNQMIDEARYRHHQHRNKFKEAIDYLDQIFEDLKKEGDQIDKTQPSRGIHTLPTRKGSSKSGKDLMNVTVLQPVKLQQRNGDTKRTVTNVVGLEEMDSGQMSLGNTNRHSLYASKPKVAEKHRLQEKSTSFDQTSNDIDVSETIVLPLQNLKLRGERMDFTRRWLTGGRSWIDIQPKPDLILGGVEEEPDIDEHSLGSCSVEVAAINSVVRKKKKAQDVPDLIQNVAPKAKYVRHSNVHQTDHSIRKYSGGYGDSNGSGQQYVQQISPIKPLPIKAHPTFSLPTGSTGNLNNFSNFSQSFHDSSNVWGSNYDINSNQTSLQKIPSHSQISEQRNHDFGAVTWRSVPHDSHYNTLRSVRSEEVQLSARKTGAFTPVQRSSIVTKHGSVASLPDPSNTQPQPLHGADPIVTIDALVAELELNTDQTVMASKRRSFPTGNEFFVRHTDNFEKPIGSNGTQMEHSNIRSSVKTKSEQNIDRKQQQQQPKRLKDSFNEMTNMLQSVISDVTISNQPSKGRKYVQMGVKNNSSILSPFETINQEKLNPSKVEAMQSMFEKKQYASVRCRSNFNDNSDNVQSVKNVKDDDNYHEINDFAVLRKEFIPAPFKSVGKQSSSTIRQISPSKRHFLPVVAVPLQSESIPAFPVTHPPLRPPDSANSSRISGYYSSTSSLDVPSSYTSPNNHSSVLASHSSGNRGVGTSARQSIASQAASLDGENDGFYDNIQTDEKRFSRGSELDNVSTCSCRTLSANTSKRNGPFKTSNRIDQFLRKIGASKPPIGAASLVSLNKVASEIMPIKPIPLMKSNSMSHCQGKKHTEQNTASSEIVNKRGKLSQRLKNTIFGSKKRLN